MKRINLFVLMLAALLFVVFPGCSVWESKQDQEAARARYQKAEAMFQERCKKSGVFIYRTAENVEGIFLLKLRPREINYRDQYKMDDPYGNDISGDGYIQTFLQARKGYWNLEVLKVGGYYYVDAIDLQDGKRYRYTGNIKEVSHTSSILIGGDGKTIFKRREFVLDKISAPDPVPRYGVTYEDISTREERDHWIAGSSLKVIDLQTNEVMAERIGYMIDHGQGSDSGGRSPWLFAADHACPRFGPEKIGVPRRSFYQTYQTRFFVEKVLHIIPEK
jgi:hypothetical protein